jgi:hypothetical protein
VEGEKRSKLNPNIKKSQSSDPHQIIKKQIKTPPIACIHARNTMLPSIFLPELLCVVDGETEGMVDKWDVVVLGRAVMAVCDIVA